MTTIDHTLLQGVPNTAFTEALAFVFQGRDLELLGLAARDEESARLGALDTFWGTREIAGVGLVDMGAWRWLYDHPDATPAQFREAVVAIAQEVWNRYFADLLGRPRPDAPRHLLAHGGLRPLHPRLPARAPDRVPGRGPLRAQRPAAWGRSSSGWRGSAGSPPTPGCARRWGRRCRPSRCSPPPDRRSAAMASPPAAPAPPASGEASAPTAPAGAGFAGPPAGPPDLVSGSFPSADGVPIHYRPPDRGRAP